MVFATPFRPPSDSAAFRAAWYIPPRSTCLRCLRGKARCSVWWQGLVKVPPRIIPPLSTLLRSRAGPKHAYRFGDDPPTVHAHETPLGFQSSALSQSYCRLVGSGNVYVNPLVPITMAGVVEKLGRRNRT